MLYLLYKLFLGIKHLNIKQFKKLSTYNNISMDNITTTKRQNYNKFYYENNKEEILRKACEKIQCEFCHRTVIKNNILSHYRSEICRRKSVLIKDLDERRNNFVDY